MKHYLWTILVFYKGTILFTAGYVTSALVSNLPAPGVKWNTYEYFYNVSHQLLNQKKAMSEPPRPQP